MQKVIWAHHAMLHNKKEGKNEERKAEFWCVETYEPLHKVYIFMILTTWRQFRTMKWNTVWISFEGNDRNIRIGRVNELIMATFTKEKMKLSW